MLLKPILEAVRLFHGPLRCVGVLRLNQSVHLLQHLRAKASEVQLTSTQFVGIPLALFEDHQSAALELRFQQTQNARIESAWNLKELGRVHGDVEHFVTIGQVNVYNLLRRIVLMEEVGQLLLRLLNVVVYFFILIDNSRNGWQNTRFLGWVGMLHLIANNNNPRPSVVPPVP